MSILEYALDVNKDVSEIINLCQSLKINKNKEDDFLTEEEIILLDNELDSLKENENPDYEIDEELESKVDNLVSKIDILLFLHHSTQHRHEEYRSASQCQHHYAC